MINQKHILCTLALFLCFCSAALAQQHASQHALSNPLEVTLPDSYIALAAEGNLATYGVGISFPVYWIEDRIKAVPLFGLMWQNVVDEGFNARPAVGAKIVYYFQRKQFGLAPANSFYAGLGGMGTVSNLFGTSSQGFSRSGAFAGYNFAINETLRLAPELFAGVNESGNIRAEIGFAIYFGR